MKKLVPRLLVISSQMLIGALFLIFTISSRNEINLKVNSKDIEKISKFVYVENKTQHSNVHVDRVEKEENEIIDKYFLNNEVIKEYTGILTGYGPDCVGCGNFDTNKVSTASGYHIANIVNGEIQPAFTIVYNDSEYGEVRIVAGDSTLPFNSIVRITIPNQDPILAIVLDRGSTVGFENCRSSKGCLTNFDLLYSTESESLGKTQNVKFEILRIGK